MKQIITIQDINKLSDEYSECNLKRQFYLSYAFKELAQKLGIKLQLTENGLCLEGSKNALEIIEKAYNEFEKCEKNPEKTDFYFHEYMNKLS